MTDLKRAANHRILPATLRGDTLIVQPSSSIGGFTSKEIQDEKTRVERLLAEPGTQHLVIDLDSGDYFGSEVLGLIIRMREACGGTTALVNVSEDMLLVLETMHLDQLFEVHRTRSQALRAIAKIPLGQRVRVGGRLGKALLAVAALLALGLGGWVAMEGKLVYRVLGADSQRRYDHVNALWAEYSQFADHPADREFEREQIASELQQMIAQTRAKDPPEDRSLREAMIEFRELLADPTNAERASQRFLHHMQCARNGISQRTGLDLPRPRPLVAITHS